MTFDRQGLIDACAIHGRVARVVVAAAAGSTPREAGASMLVWADGAAGTIGGGQLEWTALGSARQALADGRPRVLDLALGPDMGQCCGGRVTLVVEVLDHQAAEAVPEAPVHLRKIAADARATPPPALAARRATGDAPPAPILSQGWLLEGTSRRRVALWVWGAGHVGRAIVRTLAPLPGLALTWVDTDPARFPEPPAGVHVVPAAAPDTLVPHCPEDAEHLILTRSHALDLALCHRLLGRGFAWAGLIGSATKWARFRRRLSALGHPPAKIDRITCPIGDPSLGKHPQAIAIGVAAALLQRHGTMAEDATTKALAEGQNG
ncbi:MAG: xanthine dehydrogenase accessory protein XdhC [Alphaproteobacteria bacterium]|nr:MAG: xanthine dehydrogenase accessory protein XdhC [Alphaproteobacteria bacterium]